MDERTVVVRLRLEVRVCGNADDARVREAVRAALGWEARWKTPLAVAEDGSELFPEDATLLSKGWPGRRAVKTHTIEHADPSESAFPEANGKDVFEQARVIARVLDDLPRDCTGAIDDAAFSIGGHDHVFVAAVIRAVLEEIG